MENCGCQWLQVSHEIDYCPLHSAAPVMLEALRNIRPLVSREITKGYGLFSDSDLTQINAAIVKATGKEGA